MSYDFEGFFATVTGNTKEMLADAKRQWPEARVRAIEEPFCGVGIALILNLYEPLASNPATLSEAFQKFVIWTGRQKSGVNRIVVLGQSLTGSDPALTSHLRCIIRLGSHAYDRPI